MRVSWGLSGVGERVFGETRPREPRRTYLDASGLDLEADVLSDGGCRRRAGRRALFEAEPVRRRGAGARTSQPGGGLRREMKTASKDPSALGPAHALGDDVVDLLLDEGPPDAARDLDLFAVVVQAVLDRRRDAVGIGRLDARRELCAGAGLVRLRELGGCTRRVSCERASERRPKPLVARSRGGADPRAPICRTARCCRKPRGTASPRALWRRRCLACTRRAGERAGVTNQPRRSRRPTIACTRTAGAVVSGLKPGSVQEGVRTGQASSVAV